MEGMAGDGGGGVPQHSSAQQIRESVRHSLSQKSRGLPGHWEGPQPASASSHSAGPSPIHLLQHLLVLGPFQGDSIDLTMKGSTFSLTLKHPVQPCTEATIIQSVYSPNGWKV